MEPAKRNELGGETARFFGVVLVRVVMSCNRKVESMCRNVICVLFVIACFVWDGRGQANAAEPMTLRVLCYNIHYGQGTDGVYDLERLARVIKAAKPDLVALQEVDVGVKRSGRVHEAQRLGELTGMAVRFGPTQHFEGGLYGNAVLSRLPISDVVIHPLPYTESSASRVTYPRGAIAVTVRLAGDRSLRFISTHFQHNVAEDRLEQAQAINALFVRDDKLPSILAGDMNALPDSEPIAELLKHWSLAADPALTPTAPAGQPASRIDYVFYRPEKTFRLLEAEVIDEPVASDHRPVLAVFEWVAP